MPGASKRAVACVVSFLSRPSLSGPVPRVLLAAGRSAPSPRRRRRRGVAVAAASPSNVCDGTGHLRPRPARPRNIHVASRRDSSRRTIRVASAASPRLVSADYPRGNPRRCRDLSRLSTWHPRRRSRLGGLSTWHPRRRCDSSPRIRVAPARPIYVASAASPHLVSAYPRGIRGVVRLVSAIHVAPAASPQLVGGLSTWHPRRRRDSSRLSTWHPRRDSSAEDPRRGQRGAAIDARGSKSSARGPTRGPPRQRRGAAAA